MTHNSRKRTSTSLHPPQPFLSLLSNPPPNSHSPPPPLSTITTMAGDTRDPARDPTISRSFPPSSSPPPSPPPKTYETFSTPPQSANILPESSGQNTAGSPSHKPLPSLAEAVKTVRLEDFKQVHMYPCVRESLLLGIGAGFGVGGVRALLGGTSLRSLIGFQSKTNNPQRRYPKLRIGR